MTFILHEKTASDITLKIHPDDWPPNPRTEYENLGTLICFNERHGLGDDHSYDNKTDALIDIATDIIDWSALCRKYRAKGETWSDAELITRYELELRIENNPAPLMKLLNANYLFLPIYFYEHSGITIRTSPFSCAWDSGQVGFIYLSKTVAQANWPRTNWRTRAKACLEAEVKEYDQYLTGDVWRYTVKDSSGTELDACGGFFGDACAIQEGESAFTWHLNAKKRARENRLKTMIRHNVPLDIRHRELRAH